MASINKSSYHQIQELNKLTIQNTHKKAKACIKIKNRKSKQNTVRNKIYPWCILYIEAIIPHKKYLLIKNKFDH